MICCRELLSSRHTLPREPGVSSNPFFSICSRWRSGVMQPYLGLTTAQGTAPGTMTANTPKLAPMSALVPNSQQNVRIPTEAASIELAESERYRDFRTENCYHGLVLAPRCLYPSVMSRYSAEQAALSISISIACLASELLSRRASQSANHFLPSESVFTLL